MTRRLPSLICLSLLANSSILFTASSWAADTDFKATARIQYDFDDTSGRNESTSDALRRGWFTLKGRYNNFKFLGRFDASEKSFRKQRHTIDFAATYTGIKHTNITIGRQKTVFGLNWESGNMAFNFAERGATTELHTFNRMDGVMADITFSEQYRLWVGQYVRNGNHLTSFRGVKTDQASPDRYHHYAVAGAKYNDIESLGLEYALGFGRFHLQSEWFYRNDIQNTKTSFTAEAGWFLTQDYRPYNQGVYGRINPASGGHSWQVVSRFESGYGNYSDLDINLDGENYAEGISYGFGVNWYYQKRYAAMLSWMTGETDDHGANNNSLRGDEIRLRLQASW